MSRYTFSQYDEDRDVNISFEAVAMSEILDHFRSFMLASGFQISQEEYIDVVSDEEEKDDLIFLSENNSVGAGDIDLTFEDDYKPAQAVFHQSVNTMDIADSYANYSDYNVAMDGDIDIDTGTITLDLSDRYGTTTSKLTPSEK
jgi:hypothetical protein